MHAKSFRRAIILAVALVASTLSLVTGTSTAAHATAYTSFAELGSNYSAVRYGNAITLTAQVGYPETGPADYVNAGTVKLQRLLYGSTTWADFSTKTIDASTTQMTWSVKPSNTTRYRIVYSGGAYNTDTYTAATSNVVKVSVWRNLGDGKTSGFRLYGKVSPKYAGRYVYIQKTTCDARYNKCTWSPYKAIRTTSTSNWVVKLPVYSRRTFFRAVVKASNGYITGPSNTIVWTWR